MRIPAMLRFNISYANILANKLGKQMMQQINGFSSFSSSSINDNLYFIIVLLIENKAISSTINNQNHFFFFFIFFFFSKKCCSLKQIQLICLSLPETSFDCCLLLPFIFCWSVNTILPCHWLEEEEEEEAILIDKRKMK